MIREKMNYDLLIVGAGPSGLAAAINFKKMCKANNKDFYKKCHYKLSGIAMQRFTKILK